MKPVVARDELHRFDDLRLEVRGRYRWQFRMSINTFLWMFRPMGSIRSLVWKYAAILVHNSAPFGIVGFGNVALSSDCE